MNRRSFLAQASAVMASAYTPLETDLGCGIDGARRQH
jgi:hypothetical protein